ncbi:hypothetical protein C1645_828795 [Glomus cerebriforme]|uniref:Uncharacterized protein n=1 Tax=Glomus cerebriforme TaxID=658196 RepID=A0A397SV31_9GLOM|nr:hypothetical protein C1645_828795 [Glomus cerebriforme]
MQLKFLLLIFISFTFVSIFANAWDNKRDAETEAEAQVEAFHGWKREAEAKAEAELEYWNDPIKREAGKY